MSQLTSEHLFDMIAHWLNTPPNSILGETYGSDPLSLLQKPHSEGLADAFVDKMLEDLPFLRSLPAGSVNVYFEQINKDTKRLIIQAGSVIIPFEQIETTA